MLRSFVVLYHAFEEHLTVDDIVAKGVPREIVVQVLKRVERFDFKHRLSYVYAGKVEGNTIMTRNVAILIFDEVEVLDFCGPFEVFGVAGLHSAGERPFYVYTIAEKSGPVSARNGLSINPNFTIADCPQPDILLVPGGRGTRRVIHNEALVNWVREQAGRAELLLSVCTGALVLAKAGLLEGLSATTHFQAFQELRDLAPNTTLCLDQRYVDNGQIVLSAGISAGIDMSLYVVARLLGEKQANETARYMQYDYWPQK